MASVLFAAGAAHAARDVGSQRECATCHVSWLKVFKQESMPTLIPYEKKIVTSTGKQDSSSTNKMCFSCHDGFVLDSRQVWQGKGHSHPVGVAPPPGMRIPTSNGKEVFPMNDDGKMYCGTCHTAHGVNWSEKESPLFMRVKNVESSLCLACHLDRSTGPVEGNHPIFESLKDVPADLVAAGAKFGPGKSVICESCHIAHVADNPKMLAITANKAELCGNCHADKKTVVGTKHDMEIMSPTLVNIKGNTVKQSGTCVACHTPHNAKGPALWARERVVGVDPSAASCLGCHNDESVAHKKSIKGHSHPVGKDVEKLGIKVTRDGWSHNGKIIVEGKQLYNLPLYDRHGQRSPGGGSVGCGSCHDPHVWSAAPGAEASKKKSDPKRVEGDLTSSFLRIADVTGSELCMNCHVDKRSIRGTRHDVRHFKAEALKLRKPKNKDARLLEPERGGICTQCHQPHDAKALRIWARDTGPGEMPVEQLCRSCHQEQGLASDKLTGEHSHPLGKIQKSKTSFPLFPGMKDHTEDKIDCASCHNLHQWSAADPGDKGGAISKEGDATNSFLRKRADDAGLCLDCHQDKASVKSTEHDMNVTATKAVNAKNQTVNESGICGQCHSVHHASNRMYIWARDVNEADGVNGLCLSCHADGKLAADKQPVYAQHPASTMIWSPQLRAHFEKSPSEALPVFGEFGKTDAMGVMTCATCHDAHQWSPDHGKKGPGKNLEGDVRSSFLRVKDSKNIVCAECHGEDAIYRYKYFHSKDQQRKYPLFH
ncbi:MAG: hypothetical protein OEZ10_01475 [Gammaproteobacteria bacterium]|nr:hypothetical protein [Gammaproteobacteria bacterium]